MYIGKYDHEGLCYYQRLGRLVLYLYNTLGNAQRRPTSKKKEARLSGCKCSDIASRAYILKLRMKLR